MKARTLPAFAAAACLLLAPTASAEPVSALGGHDIGALKAAAESRYDTTLMDAVVLLSDRSITVGSDGSLRTTVHTIVWFSTEIGLDTYADVRVRHNTETSTLEVHALRTWRDGAWWPDESELSPTAIVETTPYAIQGADDYTTMRETMLLHDGVELPCIVETAYTITEPRGAEPGIDGLWMIRGSDPAVLTRLSLTLPAGSDLRHAAVNGAPDPVRREGSGSTVYTWSVDFADRLPRPLTEDATAHSPCVVWSTWQTWDVLGDVLTSTIEEAASLTEALRESVASATEGRPFPFARAEAVAMFVRETTRPVHYDDRFWRFDPRPAARTWETAYGHALDRAVLAAALFREAGLNVETAYATTGRSLVGVAVPALAWFEDLTLRLSGPGLSASFDPTSGQLAHGEQDDAGRTIWILGSGSGPIEIGDAGRSASLYELLLSLESGDDGGWTGDGMLCTSGRQSSYGRVVGTEGEIGSFLSRVAGSVLNGASAGDPGLAELTQDRVTAGFSIALNAPETDDQGRTAFVVSDPHGGVIETLPGDVHIYSERRDSPVLLRGPLRQTITLRLDPGEMEEIRIPQEASLSNKLGGFELSVELGGDGTVTLRRSLEIGTGATGSGERRSGAGDASYGGLVVPPEDWPLLRELLLEETDPRHRTILLR
jgi:hypothetical protein